MSIPNNVEAEEMSVSSAENDQVLIQPKTQNESGDTLKSPISI